MATDLDTDRGIVRVPTGTWVVDPAHSVCTSPDATAAAA